MSVFSVDMLTIVYKNGQPHGIRNSGGYLLFFSKVIKYPNQEERYLQELKESFDVANVVFNSLKEKV